MSVLDPKWIYHDSIETAKPGYLKRRFDEIRKRQKEKDRAAQAEQLVVVRQIKRRAE